MPELVRRADADPVWFWSAVAAWLGLEWQAEPVELVDDLDRGPDARWFVGGRLNIADNAVDRWLRCGRGGEVALRWSGDDAGAVDSWTFRELAVEVDRFARGLLGLGVGPGDRVGLQLPMVKEAAVALLACAKIGAISVPVFSGFGPAAVVDRLRAAEVKVHVVADAYRRGGKRVDVRSALATELARVPSLRSTVVLPLDGPVSRGVVGFPGEIVWSDLRVGASVEPLEAVACGADHPLLIAYTSGSTGRPKGVVLSHGGFAVKAGSDAAFALNLGPGEVACWVTDPGWIMFPITLLGGLVAGSATAVFGGAATTDLWRFVRDAEVTMLGLSPTLVRTLMGGGADPRAITAPGLRRIASSGEPWTPDAYEWLFARVFGERLPIINYSGGTEVSGGILANTTAEPIQPCGFATSLPGMCADVVAPDGSTVPKGIGELVLRRPSPGMPLRFWEDPDRYAATYWRTWPGIWHHGDWAERDGDVWYIRGRSDDTLKIAGKRVGPAEVEGVVNSVDTVVESAAVGVPDGVKGDALVVFARTDDGRSDDVQLTAQIHQALADRLGPTLRPRAVHVVSALPRTRSGKILRRVIRSVYLDEAVGDLSSIEDPATLDAIRELR
ncbi:AMP-binding protein [Nocardioides soli]|uniref:acetate--CoA ligase n=1 Tax=Nocardioides soli TaxID=1036020 RepID=A0A7W4VXH0_9ACTN|nr:acetyl-CoA synthetase [Nocardioides soli]